MRIPSLSAIIPTAVLVCSQLAQCLDYSQYNYILDDIKAFSLAHDHEGDIFKRADANSTSGTNSAMVDFYVNILHQVQDSGIIPTVLTEISSNPDQIQTLANWLQSLLQTTGGASIAELSDLFGATSGINIDLYIDDITSAIYQSGVIESTANGLLANQTNNQFLADFVGGILGSPNCVWVGWLIFDLGDGKDLSINRLANLIVNSTSKANTNSSNMSDIKIEPGLPLPNTGYNYEVEIDLTGRSRLIQESLHKRADGNNSYPGSMNEFFSNAINSIVNSQLVSTNLNDILAALNQSGIVAPLVVDVLSIPTLSNLTNSLVSVLYNNGAFDGIDLDSYYEFAKQQNYLSDFLQYVLTDNHWAPLLARLFRRVEDRGDYQRLQDNMYGPHKRN
ncbi:uncharacterized protein LODBEIA_P24370 [Lodderomyces beijingensis]|uniref:Uncharacterized protein n=1 Tax=Lodderomyces beijingensis TaxID=1775926 RepID=A0ABP0ZJ99_9ASCO